MRVLTIGAGVIGVTYSWQLQKAGYDLPHLVRKHKLDQYKVLGIQIRCLDLRKPGGIVTEECYRPNFVDDFSADDGYDYSLVAVNSNQMVDLLPELNARSSRATIYAGYQKYVEGYFNKLQGQEVI